MRTVLFKVAAIGLPFVFLVTAELVVRGFGYDTFLIEVPGEPNYQTVNPAYGARYFRGFTPQVAYNPFLKQKPDSVFRIVALGGSSAAGYPYPFNAGFPERVATRLRSTMPVRQIEMINLGMTAFSSHTLRDITPQVVRMNPDVVLIYAGHNEYYGAFGAGGSSRHQGLVRILFWFKKSVLFRKLERLIAPPVQTGRTMMAQSTNDVSIDMEGPVYHAGIENFEKNFGAILQSLQHARIPTYVGELLSNLRGQSPLGLDSTASVAWLAGTRFWAARDTARAMAAFLQAKEHDPIRFRAPEAMNEIIHRLADKYGAIRVNTGEYFNLSDSLFTDHLHPTALGYDRMAKSFTRALLEPDGPIDSDLIAPEPSPFDAAYARLLITRLRLGFPFTVGLTEEEELTRFEQILSVHQESGRPADSMAALAIRLQTPIYEALLRVQDQNLAERDTVEALSHLRSLLYWQPFNQRLHFQAAELASEHSSHLAAEVMQLVVAKDPSERYLNTLAAIRLRQGVFTVVGPLLRSIEAKHPDSPVMLYNLARYLVQTGDTLSAQEYFKRYQLSIQSDRD